jgi:hypothetical protein
VPTDPPAGPGRGASMVSLESVWTLPLPAQTAAATRIGHRAMMIISRHKSSVRSGPGQLGLNRASASDHGPTNRLLCSTPNLK